MAFCGVMLDAPIGFRIIKLRRILPETLGKTVNWSLLMSLFTILYGDYCCVASQHPSQVDPPTDPQDNLLNVPLAELLPALQINEGIHKDDGRGKHKSVVPAGKTWKRLMKESQAPSDKEDGEIRDSSLQHDIVRGTGSSAAITLEENSIVLLPTSTTEEAGQADTSAPSNFYQQISPLPLDFPLEIISHGEGTIEEREQLTQVDPIIEGDVTGGENASNLINQSVVDVFLADAIVSPLLDSSSNASTTVLNPTMDSPVVEISLASVSTMVPPSPASNLVVARSSDPYRSIPQADKGKGVAEELSLLGDESEALQWFLSKELISAATTPTPVKSDSGAVSRLWDSMGTIPFEDAKDAWFEDDDIDRSFPLNPPSTLEKP